MISQETGRVRCAFASCVMDGDAAEPGRRLLDSNKLAVQKLLSWLPPSRTNIWPGNSRRADAGTNSGTSAVLQTAWRLFSLPRFYSNFFLANAKIFPAVGSGSPQLLNWCGFLSTNVRRGSNANKLFLSDLHLCDLQPPKQAWWSSKSGGGAFCGFWIGQCLQKTLRGVSI